MNEKWYRLLGPYLRAYWRFAAVQVLFAAIFALVLFLYDAPAEAALYAAGLCVLAGAGLLCAHFVRYLTRHRERQAAMENLTVSAAPLPPAADPGEAEFRAMAERLRREYAALDARQQSAQRDNMRRTDGTALALIENRDKGPIRSNTSGWRGVYLNRKSGMWTAQITFQGKTRYLGSFSNIRDAIQARKKGEAIFDEFLEQYYADHADQDE